MFRTKTIFIAVLLYIGFIYLQVEHYPHIASWPKWMVVLGCLVAAYLLQIPTGPVVQKEAPKKVGEESKDSGDTEDKDAQTSAPSANPFKADYETVPPPFDPDGAYVRLMRRTQQEIGHGILIRVGFLVPLHGEQVSLSKFLKHFQIVMPLIEAANAIRPFSEDELYTNTLGSEVLFTDRTFYITSEPPIFLDLESIDKLTYKFKFWSKDVIDITLTDGTVVSHEVKTGTGTQNDLEKGLKFALDKEGIAYLRKTTAEGVAKNNAL